MAWARHMMSPELELRVWIATDGSEVVGVLPFVAETMARGRLRLLPPNTDLMFGTVPIVDLDRATEVIEAIAEDFAAQAQSVDLASIFWLPEGSPWAAALGSRLADPEWVTMTVTGYSSYYTSIAEGIDAWLAQRSTEFRRTLRRRARRCEEQGFRVFDDDRPDRDHGAPPSPAVVLPAPPAGERGRGVPVRRWHGRGDRHRHRAFTPWSVRPLGSRERRHGHRHAAGPACRDEDELLDDGLRRRAGPGWDRASRHWSRLSCRCAGRLHDRRPRRRRSAVQGRDPGRGVPARVHDVVQVPPGPAPPARAGGRSRFWRIPTHDRAEPDP